MSCKRCVVIAAAMVVTRPVSAGPDPADFWRTDGGPYGGHINSIAVNSQGDLFVATGFFGCNGAICGRNGIFRSTDGGEGWLAINNGLTNRHVNSLVVDSSDVVFAGTYFDGVFRSDDNGDTWFEASTGMPPSSVVDALAVNSLDHIFAGTRAGQVVRSTDGGASWSQVLTGAGSVFVSFVDMNDTVFAGGLLSVFRSTNGGASWSSISDLAGRFTNRMAHTADGGLVAGVTPGGAAVSADGGLNWQFHDAGLPSAGIIALVLAPDDDVIAGLNGDGLYRSGNGGMSWVPSGTGCDRDRIRDLARTPAGVLFAATDNGMFRSTDAGAEWSRRNDGLTNAIVNGLLVSTRGPVFAAHGSGVDRSENRGLSWARTSDGLPSDDGCESLFELPNGDLLAGTSGSGVYRSPDGGESWSAVAGFPSGSPAVAFAMDDNGHLFAGTGDDPPAYRSTDGGVTWAEVAAGLGGSDVESLVADATGTVFAGADGVYRWLDAATSWEQVHSGPTVWALAVNSLGHVLAGTSSGVLRSSDGGETWDAVSGVGGPVRSIAYGDGDRVYVGRSNDSTTTPSVRRYDDDGTDFHPVDDGRVDNVFVTALSLATGPGDQVYAGLSGGSVAAAVDGNPCPWDCQTSVGGPDGNVGINDFLDMIIQWGLIGTSCDLGLGAPGAGIEELLDLLVRWGPCT